MSTEYVSIEHAKVNVFITVDDEVHVVAMKPEKAVEAALFVKDAITSIAPTKRTQSELKAFLGIF